MENERERAEHETLRLIGHYLDGDLSTEDSKRLSELLTTWPEFRKNLYSSVRIDWLLAKRAETVSAEPEWGTKPEWLRSIETRLVPVHDETPALDWDELIALQARENAIHSPTISSEKKFKFRGEWLRYLIEGKREKVEYDSIRLTPIRWLLVPVVAFFLLMTATAIHTYFQNRSPEDNIEEFVGIARLNEAINVVWSDSITRYKRGQELGPGKLSLVSGVVQMTTSQGAELYLQGPVELTLLSPMSLFCEHGKISTRITPEAQGFEIMTPSGTVVDKGTEFFVDVSPQKTEVEVVKGKVELVRSQKVLLPLSAGSASSLSMKETPKPRFFDVSRFLDAIQFAKLRDYDIKRQKEQLAQKEIVWDNDPNLLIRFDFLDMKGTMIPNRSKRKGGNAHTIHCRQTEGMFYGSQVPMVNASDESVTLEINESARNVTMLARIRIDRLINHGNVIYAANDFGWQKGTCLWHLTRSGELQFQIDYGNGNDSSPTYYISPPVISRRDWGTWISVAVTADAFTKKLTLYADGKQVAEFPWKHPIPLFFPKAELGNYIHGKNRLADRFLGGALGEFRLYDRVLTPEEIKALN